MKKSSIIAVGLIFLIAVIVVGFFGGRLEVFEPTTYVEKIVWNATEYKQNTLFRVTEYTQEEKVENNINYDAELRYATFGEVKDLRLNSKFTVKPENSTNDKLKYYLNAQNVDVTLSVKDDNTVDVIFNEGTSVDLVAQSTDGREITYTIKINIIKI